MKSILASLFLTSSFLTAHHAFADAPNVVVSIKPIHSIVAAVMDGVAEPKLIVDGAASPHSFNLRPSNARDLQNADLVFWLGNGFETFMEKPLETLGTRASAIKLGDTPNLTKLETREGGAFEEHSHSDHSDHHHDDAHDHDKHKHNDHNAEHAHHHEEIDLHLWLDPKNAIAISQHVAAVLSKHDEQNAAKYQANASALISEIEKTDQSIKADLASVKDYPFIVFHDAYQYFEKSYGLNAAGSITINPETAPSAERIVELKQKVKDAKVECIFTEPQFDPKVVNIIAEGLAVKTVALDPEATALAPSKDLYITLMKSMASSFKTCLSR